MKTEYTYLIFDGNRYKIGKTTDVKKRYQALRTANPDIKLVGYTDMYTEDELHQIFKEYHYKLEWFEFNDDVILDVINHFNNINDDFVIRYLSRLNIIFDSVSNKYILYNPVSYNLKNYERFISPTGKYQLANYKFKSKTDIRKYLRSLLNDLPLDKKIEDPIIINLVECLIRHHPEYDGFIEDGGYQYIKTKLDTEKSKYITNVKRYNNFVFVMNDGSEWGFSNIKCINNMETVTGRSKNIRSIKKIDNVFMLTFGKYKGKTIDEVLKEDPSYLHWAYETISSFKTTIDKTKYKNVFKINFSVRQL